MSFISSLSSYVWKSRAMPPLASILLLVCVLIGIFPSPVIWFIATLWKTLWPYISLILFWGSVIPLIVYSIVMFSASVYPRTLRAARIWSSSSFFVTGVALAFSLKFLMLYEDGLFFWPADASTIGINTIVGVASIILYYMGKYMESGVDEFLTVATAEVSADASVKTSVKARAA